ncbi:Replication protein A 14 kDa subunit B [Linum grandiflorum]
MDTSNPAIFVNGALLPMHLRKRVRTVIQVLQSEHGSVIGKTTDDQQIVIKGSPPHQSEPLTTFVEVIGIADTEKSIQAEIWTNFGDAADAYSYNKLCQLANGEYKHLFL